jgi:hypothetical protein
MFEKSSMPQEARGLPQDHYAEPLTKIASRTAKVLKIGKTGGRIPAPDDEKLLRVAGTVNAGSALPVPDKPYQ